MENFKKVIHPCGVPMSDDKKHPVFCEIEYKENRLSITGVIGPNKRGYSKGGCGQIDMEFDHEDKSENDIRYHSDNLFKVEDMLFSQGWNAEKWYKFLHIWKKHHLNDMHSNCIHQEEQGNTYESDPENICSVCGYKIGTAWKARELPCEVLSFLVSLPDTDKTPAWV